MSPLVRRLGETMTKRAEGPLKGAEGVAGRSRLRLCRRGLRLLDRLSHRQPATLLPRCLALGAEVTLASTLGERRIPLDDLFRNDGILYLARRGDEILTRIHVPPATGWRSTSRRSRRSGCRLR